MIEKMIDALGDVMHTIRLWQWWEIRDKNINMFEHPFREFCNNNYIEMPIEKGE